MTTASRAPPTRFAKSSASGWLPHTAICQTVYLPNKPGNPVKAWNFVNQQVGHWESITHGSGYVEQQ